MVRKRRGDMPVAGTGHRSEWIPMGRENPIATHRIGQAVVQADIDVLDGRAFVLVARLTSIRG
jgi:hypothetical protein